jgi:hypothetical protein
MVGDSFSWRFEVLSSKGKYMNVKGWCEREMARIVCIPELCWVWVCGMLHPHIISTKPLAVGMEGNIKKRMARSDEVLKR